MNDALPSNTLLETHRHIAGQLRSIADNIEAHEFPDSAELLRRYARILDDGSAHEPCPVPGFTTDDDLLGQAHKFSANFGQSCEYKFTRGGILRLMRHLERTWNRAAQPPEDGEPTLADWAPAIRDCLLICRDLIDGKNIDPKFLRISIQTILDEWPPVTKGDGQ